MNVVVVRLGRELLGGPVLSQRAELRNCSGRRASLRKTRLLECNPSGERAIFDVTKNPVYGMGLLFQATTMGSDRAASDLGGWFSKGTGRVIDRWWNTTGRVLRVAQQPVPTAIRPLGSSPSQRLREHRQSK